MSKYVLAALLFFILKVAYGADSSVNSIALIKENADLKMTVIFLEEAIGNLEDHEVQNRQFRLGTTQQKLKIELLERELARKDALIAQIENKPVPALAELVREKHKAEQKYRDLLGEAVGGVSSTNSLKDSIVIKFRNICDEFIVNFYEAARENVPEAEHRQLFLIMTESAFFDWSSNSEFSRFVWSHDVDDEQKRKNIEFFENVQKVDYVDKVKKHLRNQLVEFNIKWDTNEKVITALDALAPELISLQFEMRIAVPRIKFSIPSVGSEFNPSTQRTCSEHGTIVVTKVTQPGLVNAFGHVYLFPDVETRYKIK